MIFRKAIQSECQIVTDIVHNTIMEIYPLYYPKEIVDFFATLHCYEHLGYRTHHHDSWKCENGVVLVYDIMTKLTVSKKALQA